MNVATPRTLNSRSFRLCLLFFVVSAGFLAAVPDEAHAIPLYARRHGLNCNACHQIVPTLNQFGLEYWNRGYRLPSGMEDPNHETTPFAAWYTWRHEDQPDRNFGEGFLPKVELITGGPIGEQLSYPELFTSAVHVGHCSGDRRGVRAMVPATRRPPPFPSRVR